MRTFTPSPPVLAFFNALEALANQVAGTIGNAGGWPLLGLNLSLPGIPSAPTDPHELAFFNNVCMPLYNALAAAAAQVSGAVAPPAPAPASLQYCPAILYSPSAP